MRFSQKIPHYIKLIVGRFAKHKKDLLFPKLHEDLTIEEIDSGIKYLYSLKREKLEKEKAIQEQEHSERLALIAQCHTEIKRLGWTNDQVISQCSSVYGKLTPDYLSDLDLLDLIEHLKTKNQA